MKIVIVKKDTALFLERSLKNALDFFKEAIFSEEIAQRDGLLQRLDPRVKMVALIVFLFTLCLVKNIGTLAGFYLISIFLARKSKISIVYFLKRVWFFIPLFTVVIAIPALFMHGIFSACIFVVRVATCVSYAVLVTITTRHHQLLRSLRSLGVPAIFIQVLDMTYRYIFFFVKAFEEMHTALKSRLIQRFSPHEAHRWIGSRIGFLFRRSIKMSEDVYAAMVARGYTGEVKKYGG